MTDITREQILAAMMGGYMPEVSPYDAERLRSARSLQGVGNTLTPVGVGMTAVGLGSAAAGAPAVYGLPLAAIGGGAMMAGGAASGIGDMKERMYWEQMANRHPGYLGSK